MTALTIADVEKACEANSVTLVMHPAVRCAVRAYEESFYIGACSFLKGESDGLYFLPLKGGGLVPLRFSRRSSATGYPILRTEMLLYATYSRSQFIPARRPTRWNVCDANCKSAVGLDADRQPQGVDLQRFRWALLVHRHIRRRSSVTPGRTWRRANIRSRTRPVLQSIGHPHLS
jgi:hypothetical protein